MVYPRVEENMIKSNEAIADFLILLITDCPIKNQFFFIAKNLERDVSQSRNDYDQKQQSSIFVRSQIICCLLQITLFVLKDIEFNTFYKDV